MLFNSNFNITLVFTEVLYKKLLSGENFYIFYKIRTKDSFQYFPSKDGGNQYFFEVTVKNRKLRIEFRNAQI